MPRSQICFLISSIWIEIVITFLGHHLRRIGPSFHVGAVAQHVAQRRDATGGLHVVGVLGLHIVTRQRLMQCELLHPVLLYRQLALDLGVRDRGIDGRHPILGLGGRLQRRRAVKSRNRIDAALELRRGDDFQIVARRQRDDLVITSKNL